MQTHKMEMHLLGRITDLRPFWLHRYTLSCCLVRTRPVLFYKNKAPPLFHRLLCSRKSIYSSSSWRRDLLTQLSTIPQFEIPKFLSEVPQKLGRSCLSVTDKQVPPP